MPIFIVTKKCFFRGGAWTKHDTTPDNSNVQINMDLEDCARDESLDSSEEENPIWDVPLDNFGSQEDENLCMPGEDMHFNENLDSSEELLDLPTVSEDDTSELRLFLELSETESSDDDSDNEEVIFTEDHEDLDFADDDDTDADKSNGDDSRQLLVKLLAFMLLTWQAVFNISDNAIAALLLCLRHFMWLIGNILSVDVLSSFADMIPKTLHSLRKLTSVNRDDFTRYAVCPKCKTTYKVSDCFHIARNGSATSKTCGYIPFYKHPHKTSALRKKCGSLLMTKVTRFNGIESLYPKQTYCYKKVIQSLETLIRRPGFLEKCEKWRQRQIPNSVMADVYDGQIWKDFQYVNGKPFLAEQKNFALMMNVDWYQPFKNSPYSVGVIYLAILNLPREEHFKEENIIRGQAQNGAT
ncbi:uncharacterized protein [Paramisgurnus dabryanus]|uniref:uncharacterized protein n=1 Tax=Paramisgurnus dabryanus TaxID=90735 RepID=UPI003CCF85F0